MKVPLHVSEYVDVLDIPQLTRTSLVHFWVGEEGQVLTVNQLKSAGGCRRLSDVRRMLVRRVREGLAEFLGTDENGDPHFERIRVDTMAGDESRRRKRWGGRIR